MNTKKKKIVKEKLPTAKELFDKMLQENDECTSTEMMIAFAKLHVEEALKQAYIKAESRYYHSPERYVLCPIEEESIISAYSFDNIV